jgi:hypothetical protein
MDITVTTFLSVDAVHHGSRRPGVDVAIVERRASCRDGARHFLGDPRRRRELRRGHSPSISLARSRHHREWDAGFSHCLEMRNALLEAGGTGNSLGRDQPDGLPSRLIPHRHRPRAELQPAHELQVDTLR